MITISEQKRKLRQEIKERLRSFQYSYVGTATAVFDNLCSILNFKKITVIASYIDFNKELPTLPFFPKLFQSQFNSNVSLRTVAVPFCDGNQTSFCRLSPPQLDENQQVVFSDLKPGKYGILEPLEEIRNVSENIVLPNSIDVMLTPGLAFDSLGRRLGRGAGYYDRCLKFASKEMLIVALAFDCQIVDEVPTEQFDVSVDVIVTPTQIIPTSNKFKSSKFVLTSDDEL